MKKFNILVIIKKIFQRIKTKNCKKSFKHTVYYDENIDYKKPRIVVYTCMTGNYDNIQIPFFEFDNVDYIAYVDDGKKRDKWKTMPIPEFVKTKVIGNANINRYIKMHPFELFQDKYDYSIYVDSNILVVGDIREIIRNINNATGLAIHNHRERICIYDEIDYCVTYGRGNIENLKHAKSLLESQKFPRNFGVYECSILATNLKNSTANKVYNEWWNDFNSRNLGRDQISLPYVIWNNGYKFEDVGIIGNNIYLNPKVRMAKHK